MFTLALWSTSCGRGVNCIRICRSCYFHLPKGVFPFPLQDWVRACVSVTAAAFWHLPFAVALPCFFLELGAVFIGSVFPGHITCERKAQGLGRWASKSWRQWSLGKTLLIFRGGHLWVLWSLLIGLAPALHHPCGVWCVVWFSFFPWKSLAVGQIAARV